MAPIARTMTPKKGKVGNTAVIHGDDLQGSSIEVKFGGALAGNVQNPGNSDQDIKCDIPNKATPTDPDDCVVRVTVNGVEAQYPAGGLTFSYNIPSPAPAISSYYLDGDTAKKAAKQNSGFTVTLVGSNFLIPNRVPDRCIAVGGDTETSTDLVGSATASSVTFYFGGLAVAGDYSFVLGFTDGAGANIAAPGLVIAVSTMPSVSGFSTLPAQLLAGQGFTLTVTGAGFTSGRKPLSLLIDSINGNGGASSTTFDGTPTDTSVAFKFLGVFNSDDYFSTLFFDDTISLPVGSLTVH